MEDLDKTEKKHIGETVRQIISEKLQQNANEL